MKRYVGKHFAVIAGAAVLVMLLGGRSTVLGSANSQEGCTKQWLFNGAWRVEVTGVQPYMNGK
jgi:hypothetical protein